MLLSRQCLLLHEFHAFYVFRFKEINFKISLCDINNLVKIQKYTFYIKYKHINLKSYILILYQFYEGNII